MPGANDLDLLIVQTRRPGPRADHDGDVTAQTASGAQEWTVDARRTWRGRRQRVRTFRRARPRSRSPSAASDLPDGEPVPHVSPHERRGTTTPPSSVRHGWSGPCGRPHWSSCCCWSRSCSVGVAEPWPTTADGSDADATAVRLLTKDRRTRSPRLCRHVCGPRRASAIRTLPLRRWVLAVCIPPSIHRSMDPSDGPRRRRRRPRDFDGVGTVTEGDPAEVHGHRRPRDPRRADANRIVATGSSVAGR